MVASALQNKSIGRLLLLAGVMFLADCSQSTHDDAVLLSGDQPVARDTKYPDFSQPLTSAMDQMSDEDARKMQADLDALAHRRRSGAISESEYWRRVNEMRKLKEDMPSKPTG